MVNYKCVLVKTNGTKTSERKTRSDKGESHKRGESAKAMSENLVVIRVKVIKKRKHQ